MKFAVLGAGMVGDALASKLVSLGHDVKVGTRAESADKAAGWAANAGPRASSGSYAQAAAFGDLKHELAGKLLIDIANPLDFSKGFPPTLFISNDRSLAEEIQKLLPQTKVVKTLNTVHAPVMVNPALVPGEHDIFVSGDDAAAKARVIELLQSFGWKAPIDLGDLSTTRGTEQLLPLWLRLYGAFGTGMFNLRVVR